MPRENILVIRDRATIARWRRQLRRTLQPSRLPRAQILLPELTIFENDDLSEQAQGLRQGRGNTLGRMLMSLMILLLPSLYFIEGGSVSQLTRLHLLQAAGGVALAGLVGKTLGLLSARWRLLSLAARLHRRVLRG
ncbi:MAG: hypothetical protein ABIT83_08715 [Massilia sp.]